MSRDDGPGLFFLAGWLVLLVVVYLSARWLIRGR